MEWLGILVLIAALAFLAWAVRRYLKHASEQRDMQETMQMMAEHAQAKLDEARVQHAKKAESHQAKLEQFYAKMQDPLDAKQQNQITTLLSKFPELTQIGYDISLRSVQLSEGAASSKTYALEVGRLHFGSQRPNGLPTTYDEQAIQNDIAARC